MKPIYNLKELLQQFLDKKLEVRDLKIQQEAGWSEWVCEEDSLMNKTKKLLLRMQRLLKIDPSLDPTKIGVYFKNIKEDNTSRQYDMIVIIDMGTNKELYHIIPSRVIKKDRFSELWSSQNNFKEPIVNGEWKDIILYFASRQ